MQAVARGRRVRHHLAQARAAAKLADTLSRPFTPDPDLDLDLDTMQDFLDSLPDSEPSSHLVPAPDTCPPAGIGSHALSAAAAWSLSTASQSQGATLLSHGPVVQSPRLALMSMVTPSVDPSSVMRSPGIASSSSVSAHQSPATTASTSRPSPLTDPDSQASSLLGPASSPNLLASPLAAPTVAQAFAHWPALAKRFQALQKQQSGKSAGVASLPSLSPRLQAGASWAAEQGSPTSAGDTAREAEVGQLNDSDRRRSHGSASPSGRASGDWLASGVPAPSFAWSSAAAGRAAQHAQHSQLETIPEGSSHADSMSSQQQGVVLPLIMGAQHAKHAGQVQTTTTDAYMAISNPSPASPSRQLSFPNQLPSVKAASPPLSHLSGPRRANSDIAHARPPQPHRTASDIHSSNSTHGEGGTAGTAYMGSEEGFQAVGGIAGPGRGARSASSLQSEQSISSQASHKAAVKEQKYKVHMHAFCLHLASRLNLGIQ